jgi:hypothetical protein
MFTTNPLTENVSQVVKKCRLNKGFLPNINPIIHTLSSYTSNVNEYKTIYITGENFFPFGTSYVKFGSLENLEVTYYSSFNVSFSIPSSILLTDNNLIKAGTYDVQVVTTNNSTNLFPTILYSNKISYTLTG